MSVVIARMRAQLSNRWSVAAGDACTMICGKRCLLLARKQSAEGTYHFARIDLRDDGFDCTAVIETLEIDKQ